MLKELGSADPAAPVPRVEFQQKCEELKKKSDENFDLNQKVTELKRIVRSIQKTFVRFFVLIKYLLRISVIVGCYFWLGRDQALALTGFIVLEISIQLAIDKIRQAVNPKLNLSEWDFEVI